MMLPLDILWLRSQLEICEDDADCHSCGGTFSEDELSPETGLCPDCEPTLEFLLALDEAEAREDNPLRHERDRWRWAITCLK